MDYYNIYKNESAYYEIGIVREINAFFDSIDEVEKYELEVENNEIILTFSYKGNTPKRFVFNFLSFISYDHFCSVIKDEKREYSIYYIYTSMSDNENGIKIQLRIKSPSSDESWLFSVSCFKLIMIGIWKN